jgi:N-acyl-D-aspartate/D-glutamate deacylase
MPSFRTRTASPLLLAALVVGALAIAHGFQPPDTFDVVIANGHVMDPESNLDAVRNIGITDGVIRAIGAQPLTGRTTLDAAGLVVAPGFIDLHQHAQREINPAVDRLKIQDGVTTAFELEVGTDDVDRWYAVRQGKAIVNYGVSVGHIPVRMAVMKDGGDFLPSGAAAYRAATAEQLTLIMQGIERGLARGAVAVGFGIAYTPEAERWEILEAFKAAARSGATAHVHIRGGDAVAGLMEVVAAATITGAPLHVVHIQSSGAAQTARLLSLVVDARGRGVDITTEMYPYIAGQTRIESALFDGWEKYPDSRFHDYLWPATGERLTRATFATYRQVGGPIIMFTNTEELVRGAAAHPLTMIASDGGQTPTHPRTAGTFSRILGPYVRDAKVVPLMEALRKMTLMPAQRLERRVPAMKHKGRISVGADADVTVFDPQRIADRSTYEQPTRSSTGITYVLVNGVAVVRNGQIEVGSAPGRPVRAPVQ